MTRGGKRLGAGRPVGTTKENNKKMHSFRLSEVEVKAVKELLAKMRGKLALLILLLLFSAPAFSAIESKPTIDHRNWQGYGVAQYGSRDDNEYNTSKYLYDKGTMKSKEFYFRKAYIISMPCRDMQANGKVYEEPNCRIEVNDGSYNSIVGWSQEDYGTFVEYDTRFSLEILRTYVYALDNKGRVAKYKIIETEHKNKIKQKLYGSYDTYELVSYFVQTKVGVKPKKQGFTYDKNGKLISMGEKQTKFSEIVEYDKNGNVLSVYRKNEYDYINEFEPDGKTLRTYHVTKYLPYLQWSEGKNKAIFKTIDEFEAKLFDR